MKNPCFPLFLVSLMLLTLWVGTEAFADILKISGAKTLCTPLMESANRIRIDRHIGLMVDDKGGSEGGIRKVYFNKVDLACVVRRLTEKEGRILHQETIAFDYLVAVTKKGFPVDNLTKAQVQSIFSGSQTRWQALDPAFPNLSIEPILTRKKSGTTENIRKFFFDEEIPLRKDSRYVNTMTSAPKLLVDMQEPGGVAIMSQSFIQGYEDQLKILALDGISPTRENVLSGSYPYSRSVTLVYKKKNKRLSIQRLIRYLRDPQVNFFNGKLLPNLM